MSLPSRNENTSSKTLRWETCPPFSYSLQLKEKGAAQFLTTSEEFADPFLTNSSKGNKNHRPTRKLYSCKQKRALSSHRGFVRTCFPWPALCCLQGIQKGLKRKQSLAAIAWGMLLVSTPVVKAYSDLLLTSVLNGRGLKVILEKRPRSAKSNFF